MGGGAGVRDSPDFGERVGGYLLESVLAAGGMGRVYRARHLESGRQVAVKTVLSRDPSLLELFRQEITTLARIQHPCVVPIHGHGVHDGQPWYAMELLDGANLRDVMPLPTPRASDRGSAPPVAITARVPVVDRALSAIAASPPGDDVVRPRWSREALLEVCAQVLLALDYVHSMGVVHGDLKPENIFVRPDRQPILVDFGLAAWFTGMREILRLSPRAMGSVAYMAPERIRGLLPDARADLYSMGCVLYECLTGVNPFLRGDSEATALAQLRARTEPPSALSPGVPRQLDALVMRLLAKAPVDRPGFATEALQPLLPHVRRDQLVRGDDDALEDRPRRAANQPAAHATPQIYRSTLVGREAVLAELRTLLNLSSRGKGGAKVLIRGETGVGKTRVALELMETAAHAGMAIFCVRCGDRDTLAGAGVLAPLRALLTTLTDHCREAPSSASPAPLEAAARALGFLGATARDRLDHGRHDSGHPTTLLPKRDDLLRSLVAGLLHYCASHPTLLVMDDVDRADELTGELVSLLSHPDTSAHPLVLVCTETAGSGAAATRRLSTLKLGPLTEEDVELMVRSMLAVERPSRRLVSYVYELSEGNPLIVGHCLRTLVETGALVRSRHRGWHLREDEAQTFGDGGETLRTFSDVFRQRLASLSSEESSLAAVGAVLGRSFDLATLAAAADHPEDLTRSIAASLCHRDIIELVPSGDYRFTHVLLQRLLMETIDTAAVPGIRRRGAVALEARWRNDPAAAMTLAGHLRSCGAHSDAAAYFETAAGYYARAHCHGQAMEALTAAIGELSTDEQAPLETVSRLNEALGDAALACRQVVEAERAYAAALASQRRDPVARARQHRKLAATNQRNRDVALEHLQRAVRELEPLSADHPGRRAEWLAAQLEAMFVYYWKQETTLVLDIAEKIAEVVEQVGLPEQRAGFHFNMAAALMQKHRYVAGAEELQHVDRAMTLYASVGDQTRVSMARFLRSMVLLCSGALDAANQGFQALLGVDEKAASVTIQVRALTYLALVHRRRRSFADVRRTAASALSLAQEHALEEYRGTALANLAWVALADGEPREGERMARAAVAAWAASPLEYAFRWTALLPLLAASLDRPEQPGDAVAFAGLARELLSERQQLPPEALRAALERLLSAESKSNAEARTGAEQVLQAAIACGFM